MTEYIRSPLFQLKVGELVLSAICAGVLFTALPALSIIFINIVHLTVFGYILLNLVVIVSVIIQEPLSRTLFLFINGSGGALFIISGIIMIGEYVKYDILLRVLITSFIALLTGLVYCADLYYIIMYFQD